MRALSNNRLNVRAGLGVSVGVVLMAVCLLWQSDQVTPAPATAAAETGPAREVGRVSAAELVPLVHHELIKSPAVDGEEQQPQDQNARIQVRLAIEPRTAQQAGIPVTVLWRVALESRHALETALVTDEQGTAALQVEPFAERPQLFWADYGFPTLGTAARPIPDAGGEVVLPSIPIGNLAIQVVEADGTPLQEAARVELRCLSARPPADRWHPVELSSGSANCSVEAASLQLLLRVQTLSGRGFEQNVPGPECQGDTRSCVLRLPAVPICSLRLRDPSGTPLAYCGIRLLHPARASSDDYIRTTDADGILCVPASLLADGGVSLLTVGRDLPLVATLGLQNQPATDGQTHGITMLEVPATVQGCVVDEQGKPLAGLWVRLEQSTVNSAKAEGGPPRITWLRLTAEPTDSDGRFVIRHPVVVDAELRLIVEGGIAQRTGPTQVRAFEQGVQIQLR